MTLSRRAFLGATLAGSAATSAGLLLPSRALADDRASFVAKPPQRFVPFNSPGKIVRVSKSNTLVPNGLWPKEEAAKAMLERVMTELTGETDVGKAFARFVHPADKVAIKPNGIAGQKGATMATNKELVLAVVKGVLAAGVPAANITIYEQFPKFLAGTRITDDSGALDSAFPSGIHTTVHQNKDATMPEIEVYKKKTQFVTPFTDATAVINVTLMKDHSICGYTGCLKNVTHGSIVNPQDFHAHLANPQIAKLYAQDIVKSRVRLHITDGFKVIYDEGPLDTNKARRVPFESVFATTDPVAMDVIGWGIIEQHRKDNKLSTLKEDMREPQYIQVAGELGLGVFDKNQIRMREVSI